MKRVLYFFIIIFVALFTIGCGELEKKENDNSGTKLQDEVNYFNTGSEKEDTNLKGLGIYLLFDENLNSVFKYNIKKDELNCKLIFDGEKNVNRVFNLIVIIDGKQEKFLINNEEKLTYKFNIGDISKLDFSLDFRGKKSGIHTLEVFLLGDGSIDGTISENLSLFYTIQNGENDKIILGNGIEVDSINPNLDESNTPTLIVNNKLEEIKEKNITLNNKINSISNESIKLPIYYRKGYEGVERVRFYAFIDNKQVMFNDRYFSFININDNKDYYLDLDIKIKESLGTYNLNIVVSEEMMLDSIISDKDSEKFFINTIIPKRLVLKVE